jgi:drug/metabolite transporter (DMT)-like permease
MSIGLIINLQEKLNPLYKIIIIIIIITVVILRKSADK